MSEVALITGASGFIGRWVRDALLERGWDVVALRRPASPPASVGRSAEVDYARTDTVRAVIADEKPSIIVHVAGATKGVTRDDFSRANVVPTQALVDGVKGAEAPLSRFVLVSSLVSHGPSRPDRPHRDGDPAQPIEFYGETKLEAERVVENSGLPYVTLRPGGVYGPGDVDYFKLFESAAKGMNLYFGNRRRLFSKIYVSDMVEFILKSIDVAQAENQSYFLCDGAPVAWESFQDAIVAQAGRKVRELDLPEFLTKLAAFGGETMTAFDGKPRLFNKQKVRMGAQEAWTCDPSRAFEHLDLRPKVDLEEGVRRAFAWYREAGWLPRLEQ
ncbi:MAG: NAD-dependent epimerase/dehydratase family protein [Myxococcota bacterium]